MELSRINEFRLFAHGEAFDPDAYRETTPLKFDGVWHRGELSHEHPKSSGVFKVLGDGRAIPIAEQERIAIDYLTANRQALRKLARAPGVTTFILGLQYQIQFEEDLVGFTVGPPAPLMSLALDIGLALTYYVVIERGRDDPGKSDA